MTIKYPLIFKHSNSGSVIYGIPSKPVNVVEGVLAQDYQPLVCDLWIQFASPEYRDAIKEVMEEMVELWNEKHKPQ